MPTVAVERDLLFGRIGRSFTDDEFDELCFEFGIELDDVTSEWMMVKNEQGEDAANASNASKTVLYKIEVPANRYDLLCLEGLGYALATYLGKTVCPPDFVSLPARETLTVKKSTASIRPFVAAAILRNVTLDDVSFASFMSLQDKLHANIGRKRSLVAIGTHDLDAVHGPFVYDALAPKDISFVPLKQTREFRADDLIAHYLQNDLYLRPYAALLKESPVYPVIYDRDRTVLSLPPVINGSVSKVSVGTKNILIDVTGTDKTRVATVLDVIVTSFSVYCATKYHVERVKICTEGDPSLDCQVPMLQPRSYTLTVPRFCNVIGVKLSAGEICCCLRRMGLHAAASADESQISVLVPPHRSDIIDDCDIVEDAAIGYGFNRVPRTVPQTFTIAAELPINRLSDFLRREAAVLGFIEVLTLSLCSAAENFTHLRRVDTGDEAVVLANPQTADLEVVRTSLLPGLLKSVAANKFMPLPIRIFEVSDVVLLDSAKDVGARNERRLSALIADSASSGLEQLHGVVDRLMSMMQVRRCASGSAAGFFTKPSALETFFPGRQAEIHFNGRVIGHFGIVHPECLRNFEVPFACSALEMCVEPFL